MTQLAMVSNACFVSRVARLSVRAWVCGAAIAVSACSQGAAKPASAPVPTVATVAVATEHVTLSSEWIATLDGSANAQIRPQVTGYLMSRDYREGAVVKKGQVLFQIDPRPFQVAMTQARGRLAEAQAQLSKSDRDLKQDAPLAEQHAIPQSQLDNDLEAKNAAQANLQSASGAVDAAELNLQFTKVTSLVDGIAAIATAQIGDLVSPATLLTTVSDVDPIKAYFPLSEAEYLALADRINRPSGGQPWTSGSLSLVLADGTAYPHHGTFLGADREIDTKTGTIRVSAAFPNPGHVLRPGQYGRVRAETRVLENALLVPQRAVTELQGNFSVRIVSEDGKVGTRAVTVGDRVGSRWIVASGLRAGDHVVAEGPAVKDGTTVTSKPYAPPSGNR